MKENEDYNEDKIRSLILKKEFINWKILKHKIKDTKIYHRFIKIYQEKSID